MGSIVQLSRRSVSRQVPAASVEEREAREAKTALLILIGALTVAAIAMSAAVIATEANTWDDVMVMTAFVMVFALLKVGLANALFYVMMRADAASEAAAPARARALAILRRPVPRPLIWRRAAMRKPARSGGTGKLTLVSAAKPGTKPADG